MRFFVDDSIILMLSCSYFKRSNSREMFFNQPIFQYVLIKLAGIIRPIINRKVINHTLTGFPCCAVKYEALGMLHGPRKLGLYFRSLSFVFQGTTWETSLVCAYSSLLRSGMFYEYMAHDPLYSKLKPGKCLN